MGRTQPDFVDPENEPAASHRVTAFDPGYRVLTNRESQKSVSFALRKYGSFAEQRYQRAEGTNC